ncbi:hypothetical protein DFA_07989 [Cavenderia fasciculata]|uniref:Cell division control protein n=1 Tax=Cavenderia fasciculata TaxID=261658 RepID=F4Q4E6_CACFS|nr:uncharacterized protein DFA_07989 [Cavenderia fasciculata]EGG17008.1 hypothetical protein DFA_07989 [Cavenderia fasciculata]|eukprot:XP_004355492.1 hypothetical protein DFA_07989 [Cavenderia fasciculata]
MSIKDEDDFLVELVKAFSLHTSICHDNMVPARHKEEKFISDFISGCIKTNQGSALYVSGQPGTGKTLTALNRINSIPKRKCTTLFFNCMGMQDPANIYTELHNTLCKPKKKKTPGQSEMVSKIQQTICDPEESKMFCVILDEVDSLISRHNTVIYKLFEWPFEEDSKLILIGIANDLDLLEKSMPRLSKKQKKPAHLNFEAYKSDQIYQILKNRIESVTDDYEDAFQDEALQFIAKRIEKRRGDIRLALEICRTALEQKRIEFREDPSKLPESGSICTLDDVSKIMDSYFDNSFPDTIIQLPLHSQLLLISLLSCPLEMIFTILHQNYISNCKSINIKPVNKNEFFDVFSSVSSCGLVNIQDVNKEETKRKVSLVCGVSDVVNTLFRNRLLQPLVEGFKKDDSDDDDDDDDISLDDQDQDKDESTQMEEDDK